MIRLTSTPLSLFLTYLEGFRPMLEHFHSHACRVRKRTNQSWLMFEVGDNGFFLCNYCYDIAKSYDVRFFRNKDRLDMGM